VDFKVLYTEEALADLKAVMGWSWEKHPGTSEKFANSLLNHVDLLKEFPYLGTRVKDHPGVRQLLHSPLQIYYRVREDKGVIEILHFWHAARQQPEL